MKFKYVIASLGMSLVLSSCGQTPTPTLDSISLSGSYQTEYVVGEAYNSTGLVVTAKYSDESTKQVANYTVSGFDSSSVGQKTVVITYLEKTASYTVNVSAVDPTHIDITINVTVSGIETYAKNHSHIYMYQKFASNEWSFTPMKNSSGHLWTVTFNQVKVGKSYEYNIYYGDENLPDLDNGKNVINGSSSSLTVTADKTVYPLTASFNVVEPPVLTLDSISLEGGYKTTYKVGEALDLTGLVVVAHYSDNSTGIVSNYSKSGFDSSKKGTCEVVISYTENEVTKTAGFTATITNLLKSIAIKTKPNKTVYEYGEEFSDTGLQVTATYEDGTTKDVTDFTVSGYNKTVIGEQTITVSYEEDDIVKTATFTVKVNNSVVSIEAVHLPNKLEYLPTERFDASGLVVVATLKNGTKIHLQDEDFTLSGVDTTTAGEKTVTIKYKDNEEITTSFKFNVRQPDTSDVTSLEITTKPTKLVYYLGEDLDLSGMVLTATFVNEEKEVIDAGYTVSGFDSETIGEKTITISFGETATFTVEVKKCYQAITLAVTVSGLDDYKDTYSKIYINHNFGLENPEGEWVTEVMTQDQTNKDLWTVTFNNIETEKTYKYNCYFGSDDAADMTYGKNILDTDYQSVKVVRGTTEYTSEATFQISEVEKEFDLVIKPKVKTTSTADEELLGDEVYMYVWDSQSDSKSQFIRKDDGFYHKQFTVTLINGKAELSFNAGLSNYDDTPDAEWAYQMGEYDGTTFKPYDNGYKLNITTSTTATVEYNALFNGQPTFNTYELQVTVNIEGDVSEIVNIKFIANYDNTETYRWDLYKVEEVKATNVMTIKDLDFNKPLYFKIYVYNTDKSEYRVGGAEGANFGLIPNYKAAESASISFNVGETVGECEVASRKSGTMSFANQVTTVYGNEITITPTFTGHASEDFIATYEGTNIRIDGNKIIGLKSGTVTKVKLTSTSGLTCVFSVEVKPSLYQATWTRDWLNRWDEGSVPAISVSEGWFDSNPVEEISGMGADFYNGIDISSCKALYNNGTKFYNTDGVEQSLFYILKENGVNWIRVRLWVDPQTSSTQTTYGGGSNDLETDKWIIKEAKAAGLKVLLDFHYSDFWAHPGQQVVPKSWWDANDTAETLSVKIKNYTADTLTTLKNNGCLPDMVQLGNEISSGMFLQSPGADTFKTIDYKVTYDEMQTYEEPNYIHGSLTSNDIKGLAGSDNMKTYLAAASAGVDQVDSSIEKVIHWAKGQNFGAAYVNNFFNSLNTIDYDYAGISLYVYDCVDSMDAVGNFFHDISISKPWFIAETSYAFSGSSYVDENQDDVTNFSVNNWKNNGDNDHNYVATWRTLTAHGEANYYSFTGLGQAHFIHDFTSEVVSAGGKGVFYWEGAWVPNVNVGWASARSLNTWGNQGFFSYDGKAIGNINIFKQMSPHI